MRQIAARLALRDLVVGVPGTTMRTVPGVASERETKSAMPPRAANDSSNRARIRLMADLPLVYYSTPGPWKLEW
jgi:hypothetical protein